jgi:hypothetical protein
MGDAVLILMLVVWAVCVVAAGRSASPRSRPAATRPSVRSFALTVVAVVGGCLVGDLLAGGIDDVSETLILGAAVGSAVWFLDRALAAHRERQRRRYTVRPSR